MIAFDHQCLFGDIAGFHVVQPALAEAEGFHWIFICDRMDACIEPFFNGIL
jgi:hypothetical protein